MQSSGYRISILLFIGICFGVLATQALFGQDYTRPQTDRFGNPTFPGDNRFPGGSNNTANRYGDLSTIGTNPFENPDEQEPRDSTEREPKIRKPLESYLFDDSTRVRPNFSWQIDMLRNRINLVDIDTTLHEFQLDYPFQRVGLGDAYQGNLGAASIPLSYFDRPRYSDYSFAQAFDRYYFKPDNAPYFNVKKPFTHFNYLMSGQKKYYEENFGILHAQNISPSSGFHLNYKSRGERGRYNWSKARAKNLSFGFSHTGKKYTVHAGYIYNAELNKENGGIVNDTYITNPDDEVTGGMNLSESIPTKLSDAHNTIKNNTYYVIQSYGIPLRKLEDDDFSIADRSSIFVGHSFEYNRWYKLYTDTFQGTIYDDLVYTPGEETPEQVKRAFYDNWYVNPTNTRDSIFESKVANRFFVQIQPWDRDGIIGTIDAGVGIDNHYFYQFVPNQFISGRGNKAYRTSYYAYGSIEGKFKKYLDWGADAVLHPSGYSSGDLNIGAHIDFSAYIKDRPITLSGKFVYDRSDPDYWKCNLFSNHYVWNNSFEKENETRIEALLSIPSINMEVGAQHSMINNKIYFDQYSLPVQNSGSVNVTGLYARKDFRLGGFHFNHRVLLQWSSSQEVIPVPLASVYLSYLFEFDVVKDVLRMQVGLDGRYNTKYYAFGYNPATAQFYNQREKRYGEYPKIDIFVNAKWKRMRILLKLEHLNQDLITSRNYFTVLHHPQKPRIFKLGFSWAFYD